MTLKRKRKIKNFIADFIIYELCILLAIIIIFIGLGLAYLIALSLTFKAVRIGLVVMSIIGALIMMFKEFREE